MAETNNAHISIAGVVPRPLLMRFADGEHLVPGWAVAQFGEEELLAGAEAIAAVRFEDFLSSTLGEMSAAVVRRFQTSFMTGQVGGL